MDIQPIKTEQDYDLALSTIEELWEAKEGTDEGDRLDILITLVDAYEQVNNPIYPPVPVAAIEFHMDQNELTRGVVMPTPIVMNRFRQVSTDFDGFENHA